MHRFALIGVAGYVAPRHLQAIQTTGNTLVAALDPSDSVGVIDSYFPEADFFTEFERFDRHLHKLRRAGNGVDHVSVCSPNYLHDSHVRFALRSDATAICEKPLVLNPWNVDALGEIEEETGRRVYTILQLRLHPAIVALKERIAAAGSKKHDVDLTYITSRGKWYLFSWKGDVDKSGGIATNIGIHFFDMLLWIFGDVQESHVYVSEANKAVGYLELERARVRWHLSIDVADLPQVAVENGARTHRSITIDGSELEFSGGFTDLHVRSYEEALAGRGFGLDAVRPSVELAHAIRAAEVSCDGRRHPTTMGV